MSCSTASIPAPNHKRSLFGSYVVLFPFPSLKDEVEEVAKFGDARTGITRRLLSGDTSAFAILICDSFQKRHNFNFHGNWTVLCSSSEPLDVCNIPSESSLLRPVLFTFDDAKLEQSPLYILTHRLAIFVTAFDRSLHPYRNSYLVTTSTPFTSLQHNYKVCPTRGTESCVGEDAWVSISPVGDCYVSITYSSERSAWRRLFISPGHSVLFHSSVTFRFLCVNVSFTALIAIWADLSEHDEMSLSLQRFPSTTDDTVRPIEKPVLFSSSLYIPYFHSQVVLSDSEGAFHPLSVDPQPYQRDNPPVVEFVRNGVPKNKFFCVPIVEIDSAPDMVAEEFEKQEDPECATAAEDEIEPVVSKKKRVSSVAARILDRRERKKQKK